MALLDPGRPIIGSFQLARLLHICIRRWTASAWVETFSILWQLFSRRN
jgi:hypothetical protein